MSRREPDPERFPSTGSLEGLREFNRLRVVDALRERTVASRGELARLTGLSRTTVTAVLSDLERVGLVVQRDDAVPAATESRKGRPPRRFALDASAGAAVGVDFDHGGVRVAVADLSSRVLGERELALDVDRDATDALDAAAAMVVEVLAETGVARGQLVGAGMGLPGPIDSQTGTVGTSVLLPGWVGLRPAQEMATRLGIHVHVDNDANLGALAELLFGAARGLRHVIYVKVSGGIGAALVLDGRVYRGSAGKAGELGHVEVQADGAICRCGNRGCLETVASAPVLVGLLRAVHGPRLTLGDVLALVRGGDLGAQRVVADAGRAIGRLLGDSCNVLNPEAIVVGGELTAAGETFLDGIREAIDRRALPTAGTAVDVRPAILGDRAGVLGALALVIGDTERLRSAGLVALHA
jgi:predicted NBD/HSP70 family sugar kinase